MPASYIGHRADCAAGWPCGAGVCPAQMVVNPMRQPQSIRFHLTAVFLLFFLLVVILGSFSIWRLTNFNRLSADVAEVWLPTTRALGDLNNFTSDFRAFEGSDLLSTDPSESRQRKNRWRNSTAPSRKPSGASSASGTIRPKTDLTGCSRNAGTSIGLSSTRCWRSRARPQDGGACDLCGRRARL